MNEKVIINVEEDEMRVPKQVYSFHDYFELWTCIYRGCYEFVMLFNFLVQNSTTHPESDFACGFIICIVHLLTLLSSFSITPIFVDGKTPLSIY